MKTKPKSCVAAADADPGVGEKMKSVILYPYGPLTGSGYCRLMHAKNLAITSAVYTINISLLIVLIYAWRISANTSRASQLEDVYYGVQVAYFAIIGTQMSMVVLSVMLLFGIQKENPGLMVPWIFGYITFMALEAVAMVYSNVLRDHVNKQFDAACKAEVAFFVVRAFVNVLAMWGVLRFYNLVRTGITWRGPEAKTALTSASAAYPEAALGAAYVECGHRRRRRSANAQQQRGRGCCACFDFDFDDDDGDWDEGRPDDGCDDDCCYGSGVYNEDYNEDDEDNDEDNDNDNDNDNDDEDEEEAESSDCSMLGSSPVNKRSERCQRARNNNIRSVLISKRHNKYKIARPQTRLEVINESERSAGSGSDENDSLLVAYDSRSSLGSV